MGQVCGSHFLLSKKHETRSSDASFFTQMTNIINYEVDIGDFCIINRQYIINNNN